MSKWQYNRLEAGERIRKRRIELRLTQEQVAERIDRVPKYCADIERGSCGMSIDTLFGFSQALRMSPSTILFGSSMPFAEDGDLIDSINQGLAECTEEQLRGIMEIVRLFTTLN